MKWYVHSPDTPAKVPCWVWIEGNNEWMQVTSPSLIHRLDLGADLKWAPLNFADPNPPPLPITTEKTKPPTQAQVEFLKRHGYKGDLSFDAAGKLITQIITETRPQPGPAGETAKKEAAQEPPAFTQPRDVLAFGSLSARDWFAGQMLNGWAAGRNNADVFKSASSVEYVAETCYKYADAMLTEREKRP